MRLNKQGDMISITNMKKNEDPTQKAKIFDVMVWGAKSGRWKSAEINTKPFVEVSWVIRDASLSCRWEERIKCEDNREGLR